MERLEIIQNYYASYDEEARLSSRHGTVEFLTTVRYIEKYLKPGMKILEIGTGTGQYAHYFARRGYEVEGIDLVESNLEKFRENTLPGEKVTVRQGDAVHLDDVESDRYDVTLLLGPMYHLFDKHEKLSALSEAIRVTKKGGIVFAAYCQNEATVIQFCFQRGMIKSYFELMDPETFQCLSRPSEIFELYRKEEIDELMSHFPVTRLHYVGTDMATNYMRECVDGMDDETFALYLKYHFVICERADCVGTSHHSLDIFQKEA